MTQIDIPEVEWSEWELWAERSRIPDCGFPGIYRLAVGSVSSLPEKGGWARVRYIGMTLRPPVLGKRRPSGLLARWRDLDRSLQGKGGHSGGDRMFQEYGPLVVNTFSNKKAQNMLFVSAMPYKPNSRLWMLPADGPDRLREAGVICYLEYEALAQYSQTLPRNRRPKFNIK